MRKIISILIIMTFLCQNLAFCLPERNSTLRAPMRSDKDMEQWIQLQYRKQQRDAPLNSGQLRARTLERTEEYEDKMEMGRKAAEYFVGRLVEQLKDGKKVLVVFPTGRTPEYFYDLLPHYINQLLGREEWERLVRDGTIRFANLDEYVFPVPEGTDEALRHPATLSEFVNNLELIFGPDLGPIVKEVSYGYYMQQVYGKLGIPETAVSFINAFHNDPRQAAKDYEETFTRTRLEGRKIIRVYGIGPAEEEEGMQDVHLAFLKRGTPFTQKATHYTDLTPAAKAQNREVFDQTVGPGVMEVPTHAITTGYPDEDDIIIVLASGEEKALSLYLIMSNEPTPEIPATFIHRCNDVMVFVDKASFSKVRDMQAQLRQVTRQEGRLPVAKPTSAPGGYGKTAPQIEQLRKHKPKEPLELTSQQAWNLFDKLCDRMESGIHGNLPSILRPRAGLIWTLFWGQEEELDRALKEGPEGFRVLIETKLADRYGRRVPDFDAIGPISDKGSIEESIELIKQAFPTLERDQIFILILLDGLRKKMRDKHKINCSIGYYGSFAGLPNREEAGHPKFRGKVITDSELSNATIRDLFAEEAFEISRVCAGSSKEGSDSSDLDIFVGEFEFADGTKLSPGIIAALRYMNYEHFKPESKRKIVSTLKNFGIELLEDEFSTLYRLGDYLSELRGYLDDLGLKIDPSYFASSRSALEVFQRIYGWSPDLRSKLIVTFEEGIRVIYGMDYSFTSLSTERHPATERQDALDPDLTALSGQNGKRLAKVLRQVLEEVQFDLGNSELRNATLKGDYDTRPFPLPSSVVGIEEMRSKLNESFERRDRPNVFTSRLKLAFEFFMFGESLSREELEELFGRDLTERIDDFINLSLFIVTQDHRIRMNGLSLMSKELKNGEVIYILADTPPYFETRMGPRRVYVGDDSYLLMDRVSKASNISGYCVDMGSGSGIQLIAALKLFPAATKAIGLEIDRRAIHVSQFNAALNGLDDRIVVVENEAALRKELDGNPISLAMLNPPFKALPEFIELDLKYRAALSDVSGISEGTHGLQVDLRELFIKAAWGGEDGLFVTNQFLEVLWPLMEPNGQVIIYSHFAGNAQGSTKIAEYVQAREGFNFAFESLGLRTVFSKLAREGVGKIPATWTAFDNSRSIVGLIIQQNPQLSGKEDLLEEFIVRIAGSYQRQGITRFHEGYVVLSASGAIVPAVIPQVTKEQQAALDRLAREIEQRTRGEERVLKRLLSPRNFELLARSLSVDLTVEFPGQSIEEIAALVERTLYGKPIASSGAEVTPVVHRTEPAALPVSATDTEHPRVGPGAFEFDLESMVWPGVGDADADGVSREGESGQASEEGELAEGKDPNIALLTQVREYLMEKWARVAETVVQSDDPDDIKAQLRGFLRVIEEALEMFPPTTQKALRGDLQNFWAVEMMARVGLSIEQETVDGLTREIARIDDPSSPLTAALIADLNDPGLLEREYMAALVALDERNNTATADATRQARKAGGLVEAKRTSGTGQSDDELLTTPLRVKDRETLRRLLPDGADEDVLQFVMTRFGSHAEEALRMIGQPLFNKDRWEFIDRALTYWNLSLEEVPIFILADLLHYKKDEMEIEAFPIEFQELMLKLSLKHSGFNRTTLAAFWAVYSNIRQIDMVELVRKRSAMQPLLHGDQTSAYFIFSVKETLLGNIYTEDMEVDDEDIIRILREKTDEELANAFLKVSRRRTGKLPTYLRLGMTRWDIDLGKGREDFLRGRWISPDFLKGALQAKDLQCTNTYYRRDEYRVFGDFWIWLVDDELVGQLKKRAKEVEKYATEEGNLLLSTVEYEIIGGDEIAEAHTVVIEELQAWLRERRQIGYDLLKWVGMIMPMTELAFREFAKERGVRRILVPVASYYFENLPSMHRNTIERLDRLYDEAGYRLVRYNGNLMWQFDLSEERKADLTQVREREGQAGVARTSAPDETGQGEIAPGMGRYGSASRDRRWAPMRKNALLAQVALLASDVTLEVEGDVCTTIEQERLANIVRVNTVVTETKESAEWRAARRIADLIKSKNERGEKTVLGLATGGTYEGIYAKLIEITKAEGISWANVVTFNLDEYVWQAHGYPEEYRGMYYEKESYRNYMYNNLFTWMIENAGLREENIHLMDGFTNNPALEARLYEEAIIRETNGERVDLQVLGIGVEGHIAFIEARPDMPLEEFLQIRTKEEELAPSTRETNSRFFGNNINAVPTHAMTQGISTILKAKEILLVGTGLKKMGAITKTVAEDATSDVPASVLQLHERATVVVDRAAAQGLIELANASRKQQVDSMEDIIVVAAKNITDKDRFRSWLAEVDQSKAVVVIAMNMAQYRKVEDLKNLVHIKVANITLEEARQLGLKQYQILKLTEERVEMLDILLEDVVIDIYQNHMPLTKRVTDDLDRDIVEAIAEGV